MMRQVDRLENTVDSIFSDNEAEADLLSETNLNEMIKSLNDDAFSDPEGKISNYIDKYRFDQALNEAQKIFSGLFEKLD